MHFTLVPFLCLAALPLSKVLATPTLYSQQILGLFEKHDTAKTNTRHGPSGKRQQNDTLCDAGSAQWTGIIPIDDQRNMFYWYFESRHAPEDAPLIIWLNGGPGASSLIGAFHEIGPCSVSEDGKTTSRSDTSWTEFANMLFIDQPIGVGFSDPQDRDLWTKNLRDGAVDLDKFLDIFFGSHFPELRDRPIHLAAESFGGKYGPVYADMMRRKFSSVVLVNAMVNFPNVQLGLYDHFCDQKRLAEVSTRGMSASSCREMEALYPDCERQGRLCDATYDTETCRIAALEKCFALQQVYWRHVVPGGENPYDDRASCLHNPPICGRLGMEAVAAYLNQGWVQDALGLNRRHFKPVNMDFNVWWSDKADMLVPSTREIARLLDEKDTSILVLNGNNDAIVSTEGTARSYNEMLWSGHAEFRLAKFVDWYSIENKTGQSLLRGQMKASKNLMMVTIDEAGHMSPHDQPEATSQIMRAWLAETSSSSQVEMLKHSLLR